MSSEIYTWDYTKKSTLDKIRTKIGGAKFLFCIEYESYKIECILEKINIKSWRQHCWRMIIGADAYHPYQIAPLKILFANPIKCIVDDEAAYLNNLSRYKNITGTKMLELAKTICINLGYKFLYLFDGSSLEELDNDITISLMEFKIITKGTTFYMSRGFDLSVNMSSMFRQYKDENDFKKQLAEVIEEFRQIKIDTIIDICQRSLQLIYELIKENKTIVITTHDYNSYYIEDDVAINEYVSMGTIRIKKILNDIYDLLSIIRSATADDTKIEYLWQVFENLVDDHKYASYSLLHQILFDRSISSISNEDRYITINFIWRKLCNFLESFKNGAYLFVCNLSEPDKKYKLIN